jgi:hypothetical protein
MTVLSFGRDAQGYNAYAPQFASDNYSATITTGTAATVTVPSNHAYWIAVFSMQPGTNVWVANNGTAAIPVGATFASSTSFLNPGSRLVKAGDVLSMITDDTTADVGVAFYAVSYP